MVDFNIELAKAFLDSQMRNNPSLVDVRWNSANSELGGVDGDGFQVYWDYGSGWTDAVSKKGYSASQIHAVIQVKTDVEYPQPDAHQFRGFISVSCGECEGICCCTKTFPWSLEGAGAPFSVSGTGFDDVEYWNLDSQIPCVPISGSVPICEDNCNVSLKGCRGFSNNNQTFGEIQDLELSCICFGCTVIRRKRIALNRNTNPLKAREYIAVRVYKKSTDGIKDHELLGVSNPSNKRYTGLVPISFRIPHDDPQYNGAGGGDPGSNPGGGQGGINQGYRLQQRCWMYDVSLAIFAYVLMGENNVAQKMLQRAFIEQESSTEDTINGLPGKIYRFEGQSFVDSTTGNTHNDSIFRPKGSIPFSFDQFIGLEFTPPYFRTGSNAWLGAAACYFMLKTGNRIFLQNVIDMAEWMLELQVTTPSDPRYGLFTGGEGSFSGDAYIFTSGARTWCSSEHNFDCHMFYRYLHTLTGDNRYKKAYKLVEQGLMKNAWLPDEGRFAQGVRLPGDGTLGSFQDKAFALDMWTWGGLFLTSIQQWGKAKQAFDNTSEFFERKGVSLYLSTDPEHYNQQIVSGERFDGHSTYFDSFELNGDETYRNAPKNVWPEGTWGYIMLGLRLGEDVSNFIDSMARMQLIPNCGGGIPSYTETNNSLPWEQHVWPATCPTSWGIVTQLDSNYSVFPLGTASIDGVLKDGRTRPLTINKRI